MTTQTTHNFVILLSDKEKLVDAAAKAMNTGASIDLLTLTLTEKFYTQVSPQGAFDSVNAVYEYAKGAEHGIRPGDIILSSEKRAWIYAGEGDLNEVTTKVGSLVSYPTPVAGTVDDAEDEDEDDDADDEEQPCPGCGGFHGRRRERALESNTLSVGAVSQPRNVERAEMQTLIQKAVGDMFTEQNIPLTQDHARRAIRSMFRIGARLLLEQGGDLRHALPLLFEAVEKESKELGKHIKARTLAVYAFEESPAQPPVQVSKATPETN